MRPPCRDRENAASNYYKHRAEWTYDWSRLKGIQKTTADIIQSAGVQSGATDNMSKLAKFLNNKSLIDVDVFLDGIRQWNVDINQKIEIELRQQNLL